MFGKFLKISFWVCVLVLPLQKIVKAQELTDFNSFLEGADETLPPLKVGGFLLQPKLDLFQKYDDNIYARNQKEGDFVSVTRPSLDIYKRYGRHDFHVGLDGEDRRYWDKTTENQMNYAAHFDAAIEVRNNLVVPLTAQYQRTHTGRDDERLNTRTSAEPLGITNMSVSSGISYQPGRFKLQLMAGTSLQAYDNGYDVSGARFIRDDNDVQYTDAKLEISRTSGTGWTPFASFQLGRARYERLEYVSGAYNGRNRDYDYGRALTGLKVDYKGLFEGKLSAGYLQRDYKDQRVEDVGSLAIEAELAWRPSERSTITGMLDRTVIDDSDFVNGILRTQGSLDLDYQLQRDLFFNVSGGLAFEDFEASTRKDEVYKAGADLYYKINPRLKLGASYDRIERNSNQSSQSYDRNIMMIYLKTAL